MIEYLIFIIIIYLVIDYYSRFKRRKELDLLLKFLTITLNKYEKVLLKHKGIKHEDIWQARMLLRESVGEEDEKKIKEFITSNDPDYLMVLKELLFENKEKDSDIMRNLIVNAIYYKNNHDIRGVLKIIEKKDDDKWITNKYGKDFFTGE